MRRIRFGLVVSVLALFMTTGVALAVLGDGGFYRGPTSQGKQISFKFVNDGRKLRNGKISWTADCNSAGPKALSDVTSFSFSRPVVSRNGVFAIPPGSYNADLGSGFTGRISVRLGGRFVSEIRAVGTFRGRATVFDSTGQEVDRCDSGRINWNVRHR
jgi:hypothetical protein